MLERSTEIPAQDDPLVRFSDEAITSEVTRLLVRIACPSSVADDAVRHNAEEDLK